jgi:hypothetical protein
MKDLTLKQELKLIQPYPTRGLTIKEWYLSELEDKAAKHIYMFYEKKGELGKEYMRQLPYNDAFVLIHQLN